MEDLKTYEENRDNVYRAMGRYNDSLSALKARVEAMLKAESISKLENDRLLKMNEELARSISQQKSDHDRILKEDYVKLEATKMEISGIKHQTILDSEEAKKKLANADILEKTWLEKNRVVDEIKKTLADKHEKAKAYAASLG